MNIENTLPDEVYVARYGEGKVHAVSDIVGGANAVFYCGRGSGSRVVPEAHGPVTCRRCIARIEKRMAAMRARLIGGRG